MIPLRDYGKESPVFPGLVNLSSRLFGEEEFSFQFKASFARVRYKWRQERGQKLPAVTGQFSEASNEECNACGRDRRSDGAQ